MRKVGDFIVKYRYIILCIFVALIIASSVMMMFVKVNSDITAYLPENSTSSIGQTFLRENFDIDGDMVIVVGSGGNIDKGVNRLEPKIEKIKKLKHVTSVAWIGDKTFSTLDKLAPGTKAIIEEILVSDGNFVMMVTLNVASSSDQAFATMENCAIILEGEEFAFGGSVASSKQTFDETLLAMPIFVSIAIVVVLIILLLTTRSWLEPFILLASIGVAILLNSGTDMIFKDISVITQACSAILQIGLTMDFAIFLMHSFHHQMDKLGDPFEAMRVAVPKTMVTIAASALTTIGGFVAMCFMQMTIGIDLAKVLIKGIVISLATICFLQPVLILMCRNMLKKTQHRYINYKFKKPIKYAVKFRVVLLVLCVAAIGVGFWGQTKIKYSYLKLSTNDKELTSQEKVTAELGNQILICVPSKDLDKHYEFVDELKEANGIKSVMGLYSIVQKNLSHIISNPLLEKYVKQFSANGYSLYTISLLYENETPEGDLTLNGLHTLLDKYYIGEYYITGTSQAVSDLAAITPSDIMLVSIISAAIVGFILLLTLKSVLKTLALLGLIMGSIWINIAITVATSGEMNFVTCMVINAIQLGATIDYAILLSTRYKDLRKLGKNKKPAARIAAKESAMSIFTSAGILIGACLSVFAVSSNLIITEITLLIARGAFISCLMVVFILPGLLTLTDFPLPKFISKHFKKKPKGVLAVPIAETEPYIAGIPTEGEPIDDDQKNIAIGKTSNQIDGEIK